MASRYTKAPTFVSTIDQDLSILDSYDKEIQRINTDYNTADKQINEFQSKIDILRDVDKKYFDTKFNASINSFSTGIDLTKRGEISKVESSLMGIVQDPIITTALASTANARKIMEMRAEIKSNPKYMKNHRAADEDAEQKELNAYLTSGKLGEVYSRKTPIITMDVIPLVDKAIKDTKYEEKITSYGAINVVEKGKTAGRINSNTFNVLTSNPAAIEGMKVDFNYKYPTLEAKQNYVKGLQSSNDKASVLLRKRYAELNSQVVLLQKSGKEPDVLQLTNIINEAESISERLSRNYKFDLNNDSDLFNAYVSQIAYTAGDIGKEQPIAKLEENQQVAYNDKKAQRDFTNDMAIKNFNEKVREFNLGHELNKRKLEVDEKAAGEGGSEGTSDTYNPKQTVTFGNDENPLAIHKETQSALVNENISLGKKVLSLINESKDSFLKTGIDKLIKSGIPVNRYLHNDKELQSLINIAAETIKNNGGVATAEMQQVVSYLDRIRDNTREHRMNKTLLEQAYKDSGLKAQVEAKRKGNSSYIDIITDTGLFDSPAFVKFRELSKGYIQTKDSYSEIAITALNDDNTDSKKKAKHANLRGNIVIEMNNNGLTNSSGKRFGFASTAGSKTGSFDKDSILPSEFVQSIDWDNSLLSVVPGPNGTRLKLKIKPIKNGTVVGNKQFPDGMMYLDISSEFADDILSTANKPTLANFQGKPDYYTRLDAMNLTVSQKNKHLGNAGILDFESITIGGNLYHYVVKAKEDNEYLVDLKLGNTSIQHSTTKPKAFVNAVESYGNSLKQLVKDGQLKDAEYFDKLISGIETIKQNLR